MYGMYGMHSVRVGVRFARYALCIELDGKGGEEGYPRLLYISGVIKFVKN